MPQDAVAHERVITMWKDLIPLPAEATPHDWRREWDAMAAKFGLPEDISVEEVDAGGVPALWVSAPGAGEDRTLVHFHSGGYVMGSAASYRDFAYRLSAATEARVLVPDYRLAPEHPYPAPVEDALTVYRWLAGRVDPSQIVTVGDSAGGGLNIVLLVSLRDAGDTPPACAVAFSPLTDMAAEGASYDENHGKDPIIDRALALGLGAVYLGEGADPKQMPLASPLYAELHDLPPLLVFAGDSETLRDDSTRLVDKVAEAGGNAELVLGEDMFHIYPFFSYLLPEGQDALEQVGAFVRRHT